MSYYNNPNIRYDPVQGNYSSNRPYNGDLDKKNNSLQLSFLEQVCTSVVVDQVQEGQQENSNTNSINEKGYFEVDLSRGEMEKNYILGNLEKEKDIMIMKKTILDLKNCYEREINDNKKLKLALQKYYKEIEGYVDLRKKYESSVSRIDELEKFLIAEKIDKKLSLLGNQVKGIADYDKPSIDLENKMKFLENQLSLIKNELEKQNEINKRLTQKLEEKTNKESNGNLMDQRENGYIMQINNLERALQNEINMNSNLKGNLEKAIQDHNNIKNNFNINLDRALEDVTSFHVNNEKNLERALQEEKNKNNNLSISLEKAFQDLNLMKINNLMNLEKALQEERNMFNMMNSNNEKFLQDERNTNNTLKIDLDNERKKIKLFKEKIQDLEKLIKVHIEKDSKLSEEKISLQKEVKLLKTKLTEMESAKKDTLVSSVITFKSENKQYNIFKDSNEPKYLNNINNSNNSNNNNNQMDQISKDATTYI